MKPERPQGCRERGLGVTGCYGCICDTCANSVELITWYFTIGEAEEACFNCDECRHYDGDKGKRDQWRGSCPRHFEAQKAFEARAREAERRAQVWRAAFRVIQGGRNSGNEANNT